MTVLIFLQMVIIDPDLSLKQTLEDSIEFIAYDFSDHTLDSIHAKNIIQCLAEQKLIVSGCITFSLQCSCLAALINSELSLKGANSEAVMKCLSITDAQTCIQNTNSCIPHMPPAHLYARKHIRLAESMLQHNSRV